MSQYKFDDDHCHHHVLHYAPTNKKPSNAFVPIPHLPQHRCHAPLPFSPLLPLSCVVTGRRCAGCSHLQHAQLSCLIQLQPLSFASNPCLFALLHPNLLFLFVPPCAPAIFHHKPAPPLRFASPRSRTSTMSGLQFGSAPGRSGDCNPFPPASFTFSSL